MTVQLEYEQLRDALSAVARNVYIVNEKRPPTFDRKWKVHVLWHDGTTTTEWADDSDEALAHTLRRLLASLEAAASSEARP